MDGRALELYRLLMTLQILHRMLPEQSCQTLLQIVPSKAHWGSQMMPLSQLHAIVHCHCQKVLLLTLWLVGRAPAPPARQLPALNFGQKMPWAQQRNLQLACETLQQVPPLHRFLD